MRGISHVAIGVRDIERSLSFYRDLLGLTVSLDKEEPVRGPERLFAEPAQNRRRAVYLKWEDGRRRVYRALAEAGRAVGPADQNRSARDSSFRLLGERPRERVERLKSAGVKILVGPYESDSIAYGEPPGKKVQTCLFEDPDGDNSAIRPAAGLKARAAAAKRLPPWPPQATRKRRYRGASPCAAGASGKSSAPDAPAGPGGPAAQLAHLPASSIAHSRSPISSPATRWPSTFQWPKPILLFAKPCRKA